MTLAANLANPAAIEAAGRVDRMMDAIFAWEEEAEAFMSSSEDTDADIIVVHDSRGRLIDLDVREGLQRELTIDEFNDRISEAMATNAAKAVAGLEAICERLFAKAAQMAPPEILQHPVAEEMAKGLKSTNTSRRQ